MFSFHNKRAGVMITPGDYSQLTVLSFIILRAVAKHGRIIFITTLDPAVFGGTFIKD